MPVNLDQIKVHKFRTDSLYSSHSKDIDTATLGKPASMITLTADETVPLSNSTVANFAETRARICPYRWVKSIGIWRWVTSK